jgi:chemotaxis protein MotB
MSDERPIIIKKIKKCPHVKHGGAWKIAFADFMTAAMAFFLMLWILGGMGEEEMRIMAEYFRNPTVIEASQKPLIKSNEAGKSSDSVIDMGGWKDVPKRKYADEALKTGKEEEEKERERAQSPIINDEIKKLQELKKYIESKLEKQLTKEEFKRHLQIDITPDGLRILVIDNDKTPMFEKGVDYPNNFGMRLIQDIGSVLSQAKIDISITGHTDSTPYFGPYDYGNWDLSSDRANAARKLMIEGGFQSEKLVQLAGVGGTIPLNPVNPSSAENRRISIVVLTEEAKFRLKRLSSAKPVKSPY